ncbi:hypothetical protein ACI65C_004202 [Semiaphis heraclei]
MRDKGCEDAGMRLRLRDAGCGCDCGCGCGNAHPRTTKWKPSQGKLNKYLSSAEHEANIEELWGRIEKAVKRTSEKVLGYELQRRNKHWFNEMCRKTTEERDKARLKVLQDPK